VFVSLDVTPIKYAAIIIQEMATEYWRNNQIKFSSRKEMFLLMPHKRYMADNNVVKTGVRSLGGSPTSMLGGSRLTICYSEMHCIKETLTRKNDLWPEM
jgi:hypothetical protein